MSKRLQTYYEILGVNPTAGKHEIDRAYDKLALLYDPNRGGSNDDFKLIKTIKETLDTARSEYDTNPKRILFYSMEGIHEAHSKQESRLNELKRFYKGRATKPNLFDYDEIGNLVEKKKDGSIIKTIALPTYRSVGMEEFDEMEKNRTEEIAIASKTFNDAIKRLRDLITNPNSTTRDIYQQNQVVKKADIELQNARFPLKHVEKIPQDPTGEKIEIRRLDFSRPTETRKYPYQISFLRENPFELQDQYVRIGEAPKKPLISVEEAKQMLQNQVSVIVFSEPESNAEHGILSLSWVVDIEFHGTRYHSAKQAIYAELAKSFQDEENVERIMSDANPDAIDYSLEDVPGEVEANEPKWNATITRLLDDVNLQKFKQYPGLASQLLETQDAILGASIPNDNLLGIGISSDNIQSKNPAHWTGQNLLGKALMGIRTQLRAEKDLEMQQRSMGSSPSSASTSSTASSASSASSNSSESSASSASSNSSESSASSPNVSNSQNSIVQASAAFVPAPSLVPSITTSSAAIPSMGFAPSMAPAKRTILRARPKPTQ